MFGNGDPGKLECQACGLEIRKLSEAEAQRIAANPNNYIVFCISCKRDQEDQE